MRDERATHHFDGLPTRMRSARLIRAGAPITVVDAPVPVPTDNEVLVRTSVATVCATTELNVVAGHHPPHDSAVLGMLPHEMRVLLDGDGDPFRHHYPRQRFGGSVYPAAMGHEASGVVVVGPTSERTADRVSPHVPVEVGDRVATFKAPGAYSDFTALPLHNIVRMPPFMSDDEGSLFEPLVINYNCLRRCFALARDIRSALVLGQGFQGLLSTQLVRALGAEHVIASEPSAYKRRIAADLGADVVLDPSTVNVTHEVERLTSGKGVDLVVECVGANDTIKLIPYTVRRGGIAAQIGAPVTPVTFDYGYIHFKHFMVVPSDYVIALTQITEQVEEVLELMRAGAIRLNRLITHRFDLEGITDAFETLRRERDSVVKIAIDISDA